jgi:hypothetical protein
MSPNRQQPADQKGLTWIDIDDFSPGIYSNSSIASAAPPNTNPGPFQAPSGSADAGETWQCIALPGGGLGPLFAMVDSYALSTLGITDPPSAGYIAGWCLTGVSLDDEIVMCIEYQASGNNNVHIWEAIFAGGPAAHELYTNAFATPPGGGVGGSPYPFATRVAPSNPTTTIGEIVIAIPIADSGDILLYPNPASPSAMGIYDFLSTIATIIFGHQNRICCLEAVTLVWPISAVQQGNTDAINYTDPPNSETFPGTSPSTIFVAEEPYGYGAVGSINAGELFMVKVRGGGVVVQGDINNPTVTYLPGVRPTGPIFGHAASNETGLFYCAMDQGAHLWAGGSVSQKISNQLDDNFFTPTNVIPSRYFDYFCKRFDRYMLFSNNYLYDPQTNSWWRFFNPASDSLFAYDVGFDVNQFYASVNEVASDAVTCFYKFDKTVPASDYKWQSLPIRVSESRLVDFRQVVIRASNPYGGTGNATIQVYGVDEDGNVTDFDPITVDLATMTRPQMFRVNGDVMSEDLTVGVVVTAPSTQPAPVIHSISLGFRTREQAATI